MRDALARLVQRRLVRQGRRQPARDGPRRGPHRPARPQRRGLAAAHRARPVRHRAVLLRQGRAHRRRRARSSSTSRRSSRRPPSGTRCSERLQRDRVRRPADRGCPTAARSRSTSLATRRAGERRAHPRLARLLRPRRLQAGQRPRTGTRGATRCSSASPTTCAHALPRPGRVRRPARRRRVRHRARPRAAGRRPGRHRPPACARASSTARSAAGPRASPSGVATWVPGDVVDADALVRHADTAMLEAKRSRSGLPGLRPCAASPRRGRASPARGARGRRRRRAVHGVLPADRRRPTRSRSSRSRRSPGGTTTAT